VTLAAALRTLVAQTTASPRAARNASTTVLNVTSTSACCGPRTGARSISSLSATLAREKNERVSEERGPAGGSARGRRTARRDDVPYLRLVGEGRDAQHERTVAEPLQESAVVARRLGRAGRHERIVRQVLPAPPQTARATTHFAHAAVLMLRVARTRSARAARQPRVARALLPRGRRPRTPPCAWRQSARQASPVRGYVSPHAHRFPRGVLSTRAHHSVTSSAHGAAAASSDTAARFFSALKGGRLTCARARSTSPAAGQRRAPTAASSNGKSAGRGMRQECRSQK
jgi:hypothetical protein